MFALRRVAVRALHFQPTRQLATLRSIPLTSRIAASKPALHRSFHQSMRRLAEEEDNVKTEEQKEIVEESIATADVADAQERAPDPSFPARGSERTDRVLYVGNLFFQVTKAEIEAEFARFGPLTNSKIVKDFEGRSKGFAYVEFARAEDAANAIKALDQHVFHGRRMAVQLHTPRDRGSDRGAGRTGDSFAGEARGNNPPSKTVFVGNLSYQMSDRDLNDLFREVKNVLDVRVAIDRRSGQPRGFAHADFVDVASATAAKEFLSTKVVYGRTLRVDFSREPGRGESRSSSENN